MDARFPKAGEQRGGRAFVGRQNLLVCRPLCVLMILVSMAGCASPRSAKNEGGPRTSLLGSLQSSRARNDAQAAEPATLTKVDENVWRTTLSAAQAFQAMARLLAQTYVIAQTDRRQLQLVTEWDKFFINGRLFRNRVSVTVFPFAPRSTEVVVRNTVEVYAEEAKNSSEIRETAWLPSPDLTDEVARLGAELGKYVGAIARGQEERPR